MGVAKGVVKYTPEFEGFVKGVSLTPITIKGVGSEGRL